MTVTFEELAALSINTDALPPMRADHRHVGRPKSDAKRGNAAKRETLARRQAHALKVGVSA